MCFTFTNLRNRNTEKCYAYPRGRVPNKEVRRRRGVPDAITEISGLKRSWVGHLTSAYNGGWTRKITEWRP